MIKSKDQLGHTLELSDAPRRIVSIVPSQTELLYDLGLEDQVVGITKFCIHPDRWYRNKDRVGGTKNVNLDRVRSLEPDLIIGNKEENTLKDVEALKEIAPVWMSDIYTVDDAYDMILEVGRLCDKSKESLTLVRQIKENFTQLSNLNSKNKVLYLIWKDPFMAAAKETFIDHIMTTHLGLENILNTETRYPVIDLNEIEKPELVFLSTEPYPFNESHIEGMKQIFPSAKIVLVDGEYFTWYGSRLKGTPEYLSNLVKELELH